MIMEKLEIVGLRDVKFTDDNGRTVDGISVYYLIDADGVTGKMAGKLFVSRDRVKNMGFFPVVGDTVEVSYDRFGKASGFKLV